VAILSHVPGYSTTDLIARLHAEPATVT